MDNYLKSYLTFSYMLKNGQTYFENLSVYTAGLLKYVWPFFDSLHKKLKFSNQVSEMIRQCCWYYNYYSLDFQATLQDALSVCLFKDMPLKNNLHWSCKYYTSRSHQSSLFKSLDSSQRVSFSYVFLSFTIYSFIIYIYIERERERHTHTHTYIHT